MSVCASVHAWCCGTETFRLSTTPCFFSSSSSCSCSSHLCLVEKGGETRRRNITRRRRANHRHCCSTSCSSMHMSAVCSFYWVDKKGNLSESVYKDRFVFWSLAKLEVILRIEKILSGKEGHFFPVLNSPIKTAFFSQWRKIFSWGYSTVIASAFCWPSIVFDLMCLSTSKNEMIFSMIIVFLLEVLEQKKSLPQNYAQEAKACFSMPQ